MKTAQDAGAKYTRNSFMVFWEEGSKRSEKLVMGVINASSLDDIFEEINKCGNSCKGIGITTE